jgi:hypothetical protein
MDDVILKFKVRVFSRKHNTHIYIKREQNCKGFVMVGDICGTTIYVGKYQHMTAAANVTCTLIFHHPNFFHILITGRKHGCSAVHHNRQCMPKIWSEDPETERVGGHYV